MASLSYKNQKKLVLVLFLLFPMIFLGLFSFYPIVKLLQISFFEWDGMDPAMSLVYLKNYFDLFKDPTTYTVLANTGAYLIIAFVQSMIALYLAIVLDTNMKSRNFLKSLIFMPFILNGVAVAFMFGYMYDFKNGPINLLLNNIGLGKYAIKWFSDTYGINFSLALISMWRCTGLTMVIFIGGLQSVPKSLYEASDIDGASFLQKVWYITIPGIKRVIEIIVFLNISGALQAYFETFILTKGGPGIRSATFVTYTLDIAFKYQNFGKASAMGVVLMVLIISINLFQRKFLSQKTSEG